MSNPLPRACKHIDELNVGDEIRREYIITDDDVQKFAELSGDFNPAHFNEEYAKGTVFKERIAHGMISVAKFSGIFGMDMPGLGAIWGGQKIKFLAPVKLNTPYTAVVKAWIGIFGAPCNAPPWGHLTAIDLKTRKVLWREVLGTARDTGLFGSRLGVPLKTGVPNLGGLDYHGGWPRVHWRDDRSVSARLRPADRQGPVEGPAAGRRTSYTHDLPRTRWETICRHHRRRPWRAGNALRRLYDGLRTAPKIRVAVRSRRLAPCRLRAALVLPRRHGEAAGEIPMLQHVA